VQRGMVRVMFAAVLPEAQAAGLYMIMAKGPGGNPSTGQLQPHDPTLTAHTYIRLLGKFSSSLPVPPLAPLVPCNSDSIRRTFQAASKPRFAKISPFVAPPAAACGISGGGPAPWLQTLHGAVNSASWGILMPIGALVARHMRDLELGELWHHPPAGAERGLLPGGLWLLPGGAHVGAVA